MLCDFLGAFGEFGGPPPRTTSNESANHAPCRAVSLTVRFVCRPPPQQLASNPIPQRTSKATSISVSKLRVLAAATLTAWYARRRAPVRRRMTFPVPDVRLAADLQAAIEGVKAQCNVGEGHLSIQACDVGCGDGSRILFCVVMTHRLCKHLLRSICARTTYHRPPRGSAIPKCVRRSRSLTRTATVLWRAPSSSQPPRRCGRHATRRPCTAGSLSAAWCVAVARFAHKS